MLPPGAASPSPGQGWRLSVLTGLSLGQPCALHQTAQPKEPRFPQKRPPGLQGARRPRHSLARRRLRALGAAPSPLRLWNRDSPDLEGVGRGPGRGRGAPSASQVPGSDSGGVSLPLSSPNSTQVSLTRLPGRWAGTWCPGTEGADTGLGGQGVSGGRPNPPGPPWVGRGSGRRSQRAPPWAQASPGSVNGTLSPLPWRSPGSPSRQTFPAHSCNFL